MGGTRARPINSLVPRDLGSGDPIEQWEGRGDDRQRSGDATTDRCPERDAFRA
jgi:hypothetical protein